MRVLPHSATLPTRLRHCLRRPTLIRLLNSSALGRLPPAFRPFSSEAPIWLSPPSGPLARADLPPPRGGEGAPCATLQCKREGRSKREPPFATPSSAMRCERRSA